ncbi:MAG: (2Fe-2S)-binding protein [Phycisphaerales bacterium]|nr:MAG: (2Fe-2S)-binding protein [Phycisphaerales bacterium]
MSVDRCMCHDVTFAELRELADRGAGDLQALARETGCGTGCGLCVPYIRVMLRTGQTVLPVMTASEFRALIGTECEGTRH